MDTSTFAGWLCAQCEADRGDRIGMIATRFVNTRVAIGRESEALETFRARWADDPVTTGVLEAALAEYQSVLKGDDFYESN
jgi:hypothetical protein